MYILNFLAAAVMMIVCSSYFVYCYSSAQTAGAAYHFLLITLFKENKQFLCFVAIELPISVPTFLRRILFSKMNLQRPRSSVQYRLQFAKTAPHCVPPIAPLQRSSSSINVVRETKINPPTAGCICYRPTATILCSSCRGTFSGHIRLDCPIHVNVSKIAFNLVNLNECEKIQEIDIVITPPPLKFLQEFYLQHVTYCIHCKAASLYLKEIK